MSIEVKLHNQQEILSAIKDVRMDETKTVPASNARIGLSLVIKTATRIFSSLFPPVPMASMVLLLVWLLTKYFTLYFVLIRK